MFPQNLHYLPQPSAQLDVSKALPARTVTSLLLTEYYNRKSDHPTALNLKVSDPDFKKHWHAYYSLTASHCNNADTWADSVPESSATVQLLPSSPFAFGECATDFMVFFFSVGLQDQTADYSRDFLE